MKRGDRVARERRRPLYPRDVPTPDASAEGAPPVDLAWMRRALELAENGWGRVQPNPMVGAVLVSHGRLVGEGYHAEFGGPHAERAALAQAGEAARGGTLYVTLEPCDHLGKTPPCTEAIISAGVRRVVYGSADPSDDAGGGAGRLREAGLEVTGGVLEAEARSQNQSFFHAAEWGRPFVALKYALSLDARLSADSDFATAVTGDEARGEAHRLRAGFDAIMVGARTARVDDPLLTARGPVEPRVQPLRVVVDSELSVSPGSRLVSTARELPSLVFGREDASAERESRLREAGVDVARVPGSEFGLDLTAVMEELWRRGVRSIFCEGGGRLGSSLLRLDHVEIMYLFLAMRLLGGGGPTAFQEDVRYAPGDWQLRNVTTFGADLLLHLERSRSERTGLEAAGESKAHVHRAG